MKITSVDPIAILLSLLVLGEVTAIDERRLNPFVSSLEIVPNFLKDQASGESPLTIVEEATIQGGGKLRGKARLSRSLNNAVKDHILLPGMIGMKYEETLPLVNTQVIEATTEKHVDYLVDPDGKRRLVENDRRVAFVFLNTNPNARFVHDDVSVPVVKGTLIHFNGAVPHHTIVSSGVVRLLGPIYSNDFSLLVGTSSPTVSHAPSDSPSNSHAPSDSPSDAPSDSHSPSDSHAPSDSPSDSPSDAPTTKPTKASKTKAGKSAKTSGPTIAKASKTKAGKTGANSNVPDDNSTGDSNGEIEIPLDASMSTSLSFPAGDIPGDLSGEIDTSIEIPLDASMSTSLSFPAGDIPGDLFGEIDENPLDASLSF